MSAEPTVCSRCGESTLAGVLDGLCPRCVGSTDSAKGATLVISASAVVPSPVTSGSTSPPLTRLGDYELIEEIARGGMGIVYKARQLSLNRIVAVKMILHGQFANAEFVQRFHTEAEAAARLQHPNIVAVYEVGAVDGHHFFSMEYIQGRDLGSLVREQPLPARRAAQYVQTIAAAIHYAHEHGILHRDLKPSNVLLDAEGELRVMDFGLAKRLVLDDITPASSPGALTMSGQVLGSPNYISPEQAAGESRDVTVRSDVYSLGAIVYHLIAGRPPFMAETMEATLLQVMQLDAPPPRLLNPTVPRDLETICLKCLEKDPARRYASARDMAEELQRFLDGEPLLARPVTRTEKIWRWCKRHPLDAALGAATALLVAAIALGSTIAALRIDKARRESVQNAAESKERLRRLNVATGIAAMETGDMLGALPWLVNALSLEGTNADHLARRRIGAVLAAAPQLEQVWSIGETIHNARFSPNGKSIVVITERNRAFFAREEDGWKLTVFAKEQEGIRGVVFRPDNSRVAMFTKTNLHLLDDNSLQPVSTTISWPQAIRDARFSPDGRLLFVATGDNIIHGLDGASGAPAGVEWNAEDKDKPEAKLQRIVLSPDGARMLVLGDKKVWLRDAVTGALLMPVIQHKQTIVEAKFSIDPRRILTASKDSTARISTATNGAWLATVLPHPDDVWLMSADFSPDGKHVATATDTGLARVWDTETGLPVTSPLRHEHSIRHIRFSPDGRSVLTASFDHTARVWDTLTGEIILPALRHNGFIADANFSPDGSRIVTAGQEGVVRLWQIDTGLLRWSTTHAKDVRSMAFSPDGSLLIAGSRSGKIGVWETRTGRLRASAEQSANVSASTGFSPDGTMFAIGTSDGTVVLRSATNAEALVPPMHHLRTVNCISFSPGGDRIVTASSDRTAQVWDARTGQPIGKPLQHERSVRWAVFHPDGGSVATASDDHTAQIWDAKTGRALGAPMMHDSEVMRVLFTRDGTKLATAVSDGTLLARAAHLWDAASRQEIVPPMRHTDGVETIAFNPDDTRLATGGEDAVAYIWNTANGQRVTPPMQHSFNVALVQFVSEGRALFTAGRDGLVRLWDASTGEPITPRIGKAGITAAAVSADGRSIAYGDKDGHVMLYSFPDEKRPVETLVKLSERLTSRHLDPEAGLTPAHLDLPTTAVAR